MKTFKLILPCLLITLSSLSTLDAIEETKLLASDAQPGDWFGFGVAIEGNTAVVTSQEGNLSDDSGQVYFFEREESGWVETAKFRPPGPGVGSSVALNGNATIVGGSKGDVAYVFMRWQDQWFLQAKLEPDDPAEKAFGFSVAIQGNTAVVGAIRDDEAGYRAGAVYVFKRILGTGWVQTHKIIASDVQEDDEFGAKVAIDGNTMIVANRDANVQSKAYIYVKVGTQWVEQAILQPNDVIPGDWFGSSVGLSGDTAIVGTQWDQGGGSAYIFKRIGTNWIQQAKLRAQDAREGINFGISSAIDGDFAIVGARHNGPGAAYLFKRTGFQWEQMSKLEASDGQLQDLFGFSSDLSRNQAIVGAYFQEEIFFKQDTGAAYIYDFSEQTSVREKPTFIKAPRKPSV